MHLAKNNLYPVFQSAYRKLHSTETALVKVHNDILTNMNMRLVTLLVLLNLSAAFDTVDPSILLTRLRSKLGLTGTALSWFCSYLSGRTQRISVQGTLSNVFHLRYGVPQGSCLGPCGIPETETDYTVILIRSLILWDKNTEEPRVKKLVNGVRINQFMCCVVTKLFCCFLVLNRTHHIWRRGKRTLELPSDC